MGSRAVTASRLPTLAVGASALAAGIVLTTCALAGHAPFSTSSWTRWDSGFYLDIARHGYDHTACPADVERVGFTWCGNAGWFPAYPWLIRAIAVTGLGDAAVALALSWLFALGTIVLLWAAFFRRVPPGAAAVGLLFAAFAPGLVYFAAIFPLSMLAFFTVLTFVFVSRGHWLAAGFAAAVAALAYPVGIVVPVAAGVGVAAYYRDVPSRARLGRAARIGVPSVAAVLLLFVVDQLSTGRWDAYFLVQSNYDHALRAPFVSSFHGLRLLLEGRLFTLGNAPYAQALVVFTALVAVGAFIARNRAEVTPFERVVFLWALAAWIVSHSTATTSEYRGEAALLPLAILVSRLWLPVGGAIVAGAIAVAIPIEILFLRGTLI